MVDTTAAQLQQLGQSTVDFESDQLDERQKQFTTEMSEALHHTFDALVEGSVARLRKLTDDSLDLFTEELTNRQKLPISDTSHTFRQKIGEILAMLQNGSGENC